MMELSIILATLLNTLTSSPDLCADVYVDTSGAPYTDAVGQTLSRYCQWAGPDAPTLDREICCTVDADGAACTVPDRLGRCATGSKMYCEHGEVRSTGVICYQRLPSICDFGFCGIVHSPESGPLENTLCCWADKCFEIETAGHVDDCSGGGGWIGFCFDGAQNQDGSVDCFD
jgi:hypothetical protein